MRVPHSELIALAPSLRDTSSEAIRDTLTGMGFETEVLEGESIVYDVHVTPDRADALSILGVARELQAFEGRKSKKALPTITLVDQKLVDKLPELPAPIIELTNDDCTQYHAVVLEHVSIQPSPKWLQEAVILLGLRPINSIVDITNYLMELYGQPLHAFDLDAILGEKMVLRNSRSDEKITTLDGVERTLDKGALIIEDANNLIDLAGIMGGANSAVDHRTTRVLLQSAIFSPSSIKRSITASGHNSPASFRYIRGIDPLISLPVLNQAIQLLKKKEFGSAKPVGKILTRTTDSKKETTKVDPEHINHLLGTSIADKEQDFIFSLIGCTIEVNKKGSHQVTAPSWRFDLHYWQDYAEEIVRLTGLDEGIEAKKISKSKDLVNMSELSWIEGVKDRFVELGFTEILSYSFISKMDLDQFQLHKVGELSNPLNPQLKYLRPSLLPNLATAVGRNNYYEPVLLFEVGHVFTQKSEQIRLGIAIASQKDSLDNWIARIADSLGIDSLDLKSALLITTLTKPIAEHYNVRKLPTYLLEIPLEKLKIARRIPHQYKVPTLVTKYKKISKYPPIVRDLSMIVPTSFTREEIALYIAKFHPFVEYVTIFDEFTSPKFGTDKKSLAFHILYSSNERTLNQTEIEEIEAELTRGLTHSFQAEIR